MNIYIYNNKTYELHHPFQISIKNRAFKYGDGLFESIRVFDSNIPFLKRHFQRMIYGMNYLKMEIPDYFNVAFFREKILQLIDNQKNARIRISIWRNEGGLYTPIDNTISWMIEAESLENDEFVLNNSGLRVGIFNNLSAPCNGSNIIKSCNSMLYILAGLYTKEQQLDDSLILNIHNNVSEATSSNIFLIKDENIYTPPIREGCLDGILRSFVLDITYQSNLIPIIKPITLAEIFEADEIFLTNSIQGIRWIEQIKEYNFKCQKTVLLLAQINKAIKNAKMYL